MLSRHRMAIEVKVLGPDDRTLLDRVAPDVFDRGIDAALTAEFLAECKRLRATRYPDCLPTGEAVIIAST